MVKPTDVGLLRKITETSSNSSKIFGIIPYVDPKRLMDSCYKSNKMSDVYSVGVEREKIIDSTPHEYIILYQSKMLENESNERPNI
ncbi:1229_t:CDS:2 [Funneliformis mosseae]|uniref:1229_t:CDS:1 n=1 Tax=Funneliformis mosseae TaxID=27381 RepID=A0A9N9AYK0_FUNMO|nr:1229_t:CDS:2 [Funneliformis mosseae]